MFVGVARYVIQIPGARTLKDRRHVVKSLKERLRARLGLTVAEVGAVDRYQVATLGLAVVGRSSGLCQEALSRARAAIESGRDSLLADSRTEIIPFGPGGQGLREGLEGSDLSLSEHANEGDPEG